MAEPLPDDMDEEMKVLILMKRKDILNLVKHKIDQFLNPSKAGCDHPQPHMIYLNNLKFIVMNVKVLCLYHLTLTMNCILEDQ